MTEHTTTQNTSIDNLIQLLLKEGYENGLPRIAEMILNAAMFFERSSHLAANPYERSATRNSYANGFKGRTLKSALGALNLKIPQTREASEPSTDEALIASAYSVQPESITNNDN